MKLDMLDRTDEPFEAFLLAPYGRTRCVSVVPDHKPLRCP